MTPLEIVRSLYVALERRDAAGILAHVAPDVEWEYGGGTATTPWLRAGRGHDAVLAYLEAHATHLAFDRFEPTRMLSDGDLVVVLLDTTAHVPTTGGDFSEVDEVHLWWVRDEQVVRFRHRCDTLLHERAWRGTGADAKGASAPEAAGMNAPAGSPPAPLPA